MNDDRATIANAITYAKTTLLVRVNMTLRGRPNVFADTAYIVFIGGIEAGTVAREGTKWTARAVGGRPVATKLTSRRAGADHLVVDWLENGDLAMKVRPATARRRVMHKWFDTSI